MKCVTVLAAACFAGTISSQSDGLFSAIMSCGEKYGIIRDAGTVLKDFTKTLLNINQSDKRGNCGACCYLQSLGLADNRGKIDSAGVKHFFTKAPSPCVTPQQAYRCSVKANKQGHDNCTIGGSFLNCFRSSCNELTSVKDWFMSLLRTAFSALWGWFRIF